MAARSRSSVRSMAAVARASVSASRAPSQDIRAPTALVPSRLWNVCSSWPTSLGTPHSSAGPSRSTVRRSSPSSWMASRGAGGKLTIDQVEGDALCCTTERTDVGVTDWLRETFRLFHGRLRDIRSATTCPCRACATVQNLGLKFVVHRGTFSRYEVAGRVQLHGNDVNLVHRLLKNTVPGHEYLLATAPALASWPDSIKSEFVPAPQRYDLGEVDASYLDLRPIRETVWSEVAPTVDPATAKIRSTARYP